MLGRGGGGGVPPAPPPPHHHSAHAAAAAAAAALAGLPTYGDARPSDRDRDRAGRPPRATHAAPSDRRRRDADDDDGARCGLATIDEAVGQVLTLARDQHGCRFLQRRVDEGGSAAVAAILPELVDGARALMADPFGNYLIQKVADRASPDQRVALLRAAAAEGGLVAAALSPHGTRAVQRLVDAGASSRDGVDALVDALAPGVVTLVRDINGNHVIQRVLQVRET